MDTGDEFVELDTTEDQLDAMMREGEPVEIEDDGPVEKVVAAFERGEKGLTAPPNERERAAHYEANRDDPAEWGEPTLAKPRRRLASMISVRLAPEQIDLIREAAERQGMSVSAFLRSAALDEAAQPEQEDQPVQIERRPSGMQVISARLPTPLAEQLFTEAERRGVKLSELIREAVAQFLGKHPQSNASFCTAGFYEEDEPIADILGAWDMGEKGVTARPSGTARCQHMQIGNVTAARCGMGCGDLPVYTTALTW